MFWSALFAFCLVGNDCFYSAKIDSYQPTTIWRTQQECLDQAPAVLATVLKEHVAYEALRARVTTRLSCVRER
jgi:hypothetical protein